MDDNGFYENIQAPKFVDLRAPDPDSDDRYWFCLRVGCDQKHEEEMDSEAIYKKFILRVMAARSPNVRLTKPLCNNDSLKKCPRTVPAKPSKSRISKLAIISHNMVDCASKKLKQKPATPPLSPTKKLKQPKAMTTPRNRTRRRISNPRTFTSVRALKPPAVEAPNSTARVVAKALVFHSPPHKAVLRLKKSIELSSSLRKICSAGMKRLDHQIRNGDDASQLKKGVSRKQLRGREVKSRVYSSQKEMQQETKNNDQLTEASASQRNSNTVDNKPEDISIRTCSGAGSSENKEDCLENVGTLRPNQHKNSEQNIASPLNEEEKQTDQPLEITSAGDGELMDKKMLMDMDDKENAASGYDENRNKNSHANKSLKKKGIEGSRSTHKDSKTPSRALKDPCVNTTQSQGTTKFRKPKPTNPRPFRLRTDERQILKEANLEKKQLTTMLVKEITTIPESLSRLSTQQQREKLKTTRVEFLGHTGTAESDKEATKHPQRAPKSTKVVRPRRVASVKKQKKESGQLEAIKENSPACLKPTRASPQHTPKEPKFHSIHTPKSCMRRVVSPTPKGAAKVS